MNAKTDAKKETKPLSHAQADAIGEIMNISMGAAASAISALIGKKASITTPFVQMVEKEEFEYKRFEPALGVEINYIEGLHGSNLMILHGQDAKAMANFLLGDAGLTADTPFDEIHESALGEIMNQMMGASSTALAAFLNRNVNISSPSILKPKVFYEKFFENGKNQTIVAVTFHLVVEDLMDCQFVTVMPVEFSKELVDIAMNLNGLEEETKEKEPAILDMRTEGVSIKPIQFEDFEDDRGVKAESKPPEQMNLDLVMDVELNVTAEIGQTKKPVKEVLNMAIGTIIELDRKPGEPIDIVVNGQLIAKGDVVVVDDNFGVRITKIISGVK